mgnify:CR=1 FL=1
MGSPSQRLIHVWPVFCPVISSLSQSHAHVTWQLRWQQDELFLPTYAHKQSLITLLWWCNTRSWPIRGELLTQLSAASIIAWLGTGTSQSSLIPLSVVEALSTALAAIIVTCLLRYTWLQTSTNNAYFVLALLSSRPTPLCRPSGIETFSGWREFGPQQPRHHSHEEC